ncbi:hypothetical protein TCEL_01470 [Thermobrachium celere DSM 8682]|uniref:Uncharacterized protein n=1 Tax=Thermobrachium celere DSM 8682 TaxID=941824 RepID=R7RQF4_9CLOT|nr:hypothetical protein TCEL_01470 [Thermobrachium celere DSM 8682]
MDALLQPFSIFAVAGRLYLSNIPHVRLICRVGCSLVMTNIIYDNPKFNLISQIGLSSKVEETIISFIIIF